MVGLSGNIGNWHGVRAASGKVRSGTDDRGDDAQPVISSPYASHTVRVQGRLSIVCFPRVDFSVTRKFADYNLSRVKCLCRTCNFSVARRLALKHGHFAFQPVNLAGVNPKRVELEAKEARPSQSR